MLETIEIDPHRLCRSRHDIISHLHDRVSFYEPLSESEFERIGSHLLLCKKPGIIRSAPPILYCGLKSASAQIFGPEWAREAPLLGSSGKPELEEVFSYGYKVAAEHGWFCDENEGFIDTGRGIKFVSFVRYIRSIQMQNGASFFVCAGAVRDRVLQ